MNHWLHIALAVLPLAGAAQKPCTGTFEGHIYDAATGEPLPGATVYIPSENLGTAADTAGYFLLEGLCVEEFDYQVSFVGYQTLTHHHDAYHGEEHVHLAQEVSQLESVVVLGGHRLEQELRGIVQLDESMKLDQDLSQVAGMELSTSGSNIRVPVLHGQSGSRLPMYRDGVAHAYQAWGREHAPEIDYALADRVSVVRSAAGLRYGPGNMGGLVVLESPEPEWGSGMHAEASLAGQSNGWGGELIWKTLQANPRERLYFGFRISHVGDLRAPSYILSNSGAYQLGLNWGVGMHLKRWDFDIHTQVVRQNLGILRSSVVGSLGDLQTALLASEPAVQRPFTYDIGAPRQQVEHAQVSAVAKYFGPASTLRLSYTFQDNRRSEYDVRRGSLVEVPYVDLVLSQHSLDALWERPWRSLKLQLGGQAHLQQNRNQPGTSTIPVVPNYNQGQVGLFALAERHWDASTLQVGLRTDGVAANIQGRQQDNSLYVARPTFSGVAASISYASYDLLPHVDVYTDLAYNWRPPNVAELYLFGRQQAWLEYGLLRYETTSGTVTTGQVGDADGVSPERGVKWMQTWQYHRGALKLQLSPHANWLRNYFFSRPFGVSQTLRGAFPVFVTEQTEMLFWGVDVDLQQLWTVSPRLDLKAEVMGSYLQARDLTNSRPFPFLAPPNGHVELAALFRPFADPKSELKLGLRGSATAAALNPPQVRTPEQLLATESLRDEFFDFSPAPSAYGLVDLVAGWQNGKFSLEFRCENLLNQDYRLFLDRFRYFAAQPGRNFQLRFTVNGHDPESRIKIF